MKELIKEYGHPITVLDAETWSDVKAYGTYEAGSDDNEIWSMNGKLYRLCFAELSFRERIRIVSAYRIDY